MSLTRCLCCHYLYVLISNVNIR
uniref:Uncharacterized protein n=1 Tax=Anguilla anguilla TaxID=7936 RepID=A0A0E9RBW9_ANGAN